MVFVPISASCLRFRCPITRNLPPTNDRFLSRSGSRSRALRCAVQFYVACCALTSTALLRAQPPKDPAATGSEAGWQKDGWSLMREFCLDCHSSDNAEAELDLSSFRTIKGVAEAGGSMQRVLEMVRFGAMPPEDADRPSIGQRKRLVAAIERSLHTVSCDTRPRPGKVTARRLNRAEYNHSIRDLFGIDLRPAEAFPSDEVGAGFDNNGDLLSLSSMLMEKYLSAAEYVSTRVLIDPDSLPRADVEIGSEELVVEGDSQTGRFYGRFLAPGAYVWTEFNVPTSGEYRIDVYGGNGRRTHTLSTVGVYDQTGLLRGVLKLRFFGGGGRSSHDSVNVQLDAGDHRLIVRKIPDDEEYEVGVTEFNRIDELTEKHLRIARRNIKNGLTIADDVDEDYYAFMVRRFRVSGPTGPRTDELPPGQDRLIKSIPKRDDERWVNVKESASECLQPLMRRAFRRPVSDAEVQNFARLVVDATDRGESFYRGMQIAISAVLVSPNFLFRVERPENPEGLSNDSDVPLTPVQLATRLSFFLWSSLPDEPLLRDAEKNRLDENAIKSHVNRMINDDRSDSLATEFASQWFGLRNLDEHEADSDRFAEYNDRLSHAMRRETELLFMHVARNNLPVGELLTADYTFANSRLARHYGLQDDEKSSDDLHTKRSLIGTSRRGVLSHASVLTMTSNPTRTSPVRRGKWILENILGTPPPDPPPGVPELEDAKKNTAELSLRKQLELHRASPTCAACHRVMDQLGFGLEVYDAIGRLRPRNATAPVDASGELPGGRKFNGAHELSDVLAQTEQVAFARTAVRRLMTFGLGRELTPYDDCSVDEIIADTKEDGFRFVDLVLGVVNSRPFRFYQWQSHEEE